MRSLLTALCTFLLPNVLAFPILRLLGHRIHHSVKIGWSWLWIDGLELAENARIGHANFIQVHRLQMGAAAIIRNRNRMRGPLYISLAKQAAIGNNNSIYRATTPVTAGLAELRLGQLAILTSKHHLDCTRSIYIGDFTTISGLGSQFWTHGYFHAASGAERIRIDGEIRIGNNVSIGSQCVLNPGIQIANHVHLGSHMAVGKSLLQSGMYVAQPLRRLERDIDELRYRLVHDASVTADEVYVKKIVVKSAPMTPAQAEKMLCHAE
ncbi:MAG: hypothetical protein AB8G22_17920 [Saprospiraceae bacterium]